MSDDNPNCIGRSTAEQINAQLKLTTRDSTITDCGVGRRRIDSSNDGFANSQYRIQFRRNYLLIKMVGSQHSFEEPVKRNVMVSGNDQLRYRRQTRQEISSRLKLLPLRSLCQVTADNHRVKGQLTGQTQNSLTRFFSIRWSKVQIRYLQQCQFRLLHFIHRFTTFD